MVEASKTITLHKVGFEIPHFIIGIIIEDDKINLFSTMSIEPSLDFVTTHRKFCRHGGKTVKFNTPISEFTLEPHPLFTTMWVPPS